MIIKCQNCGKKFNLDINLIGKSGRLLQCGNCDHKWFYKNLANSDDKLDDKIKDLEEKNNKPDETIESANKDLQQEKNKQEESIKANVDKKDKSNNTKNENKNSENLINIFLVFLISLISLVIVIDTFKDNLSLVIPGLIPFFENLYQTMHDIQLFLKDLIS